MQVGRGERGGCGVEWGWGGTSRETDFIRISILCLAALKQEATSNFSWSLKELQTSR